jgi:hypothetical protein
VDGRIQSPVELRYNSTISQKEAVKDSKQAQYYDNIGFGFVPFVGSCVGVFGKSALRVLMALASLELRQYEAQRSRHGILCLMNLLALNSEHSVFVKALLAFDMHLPKPP